MYAVLSFPVPQEGTMHRRLFMTGFELRVNLTDSAVASARRRFPSFTPGEQQQPVTILLTCGGCYITTHKDQRVTGN